MTDKKDTTGRLAVDYAATEGHMSATAWLCSSMLVAQGAEPKEALAQTLGISPTPGGHGDESLLCAVLRFRRREWREVSRLLRLVALQLRSDAVTTETEAGAPSTLDAVRAQYERLMESLGLPGNRTDSLPSGGIGTSFPELFVGSTLIESPSAPLEPSLVDSVERMWTQSLAEPEPGRVVSSEVLRLTVSSLIACTAIDRSSIQARYK